MFKDMKVAAAKDKKKGKAVPADKKPAAASKKEETKESAPKVQRAGAIKKNRKDRRKDQRKDRRKEIKKRVKEEKIKLQETQMKDE